jgi:hypothetical protein
VTKPQLIFTLFPHIQITRLKKGPSWTFQLPQSQNKYYIPLPVFHSSDWPNTLTVIYNNALFTSHQFSIHLKQFNHHEDVHSTFLQNAGTFNHYTAQRPKRKSSPDAPTVKQFKMMAKI